MHPDFNRRTFLKTSLLAATGSILPLTRCGSKTDPHQPLTKRPNILWISCEDISPRLGCYGDSVARTPHIDGLADQGMRFDRMFTTAPVCAPCRSGIITGMYQTTMGTHHMRTTRLAKGLPTPYHAVPPAYVKTFTEYLRASGYYCINNAKTDYQFGNPVTAWDDCGKNAHYKNRPDDDQPFFAVFNLTMTHESQNWPDPETTRPEDVSVEPYYPDTPVVRKDIARLYDNIANMDKKTGALLKELDDLGLADNTIVFFWSDHGDGLPRKKRWIYDSGTHVPMVIRWPGHIKPGSVNTDLLSSIDLGPTVLSMAGVPIPVHIQGRPFLGRQKGEKRQYVFSARDRFDESYDMVRSVRDKRYRYIRNYYPLQPYVLWLTYRNRGPLMQEMLRLHAEDKLEGPQKLWFSNTRPPEELYDCENDPHQIHNLINDSDFQDIRQRLSTVLDQWRDETGDMGDMDETDMIRQWYPNGKQPKTMQPHFVVNAPGNRATAITLQGDVLQGPATLKFHTATQGASMTYTTDSGPSAHWRLYAGPIRLNPGETTVRAKAIRYGYKESDETVGTFVVK